MPAVEPQQTKHAAKLSPLQKLTMAHKQLTRGQKRKRVRTPTSAQASTARLPTSPGEISRSTTATVGASHHEGSPRGQPTWRAFRAEAAVNGRPVPPAWRKATPASCNKISGNLFDPSRTIAPLRGFQNAPPPRHRIERPWMLPILPEPSRTFGIRSPGGWVRGGSGLYKWAVTVSLF